MLRYHHQATSPSTFASRGCISRFGIRKTPRTSAGYYPRQITPHHNIQGQQLNDSHGVIHAASLDPSENFLLSELLVPSRKMLSFHRLGQMASLLITIEGPTLPRDAVLCSTVFKLYSPLPNSQECFHCFSWEHRTLVSPTQNVFLRCATCGTAFPLDQSISDTCHDFFPLCVKCSGENL
ncbi:hypothetical protein HPB48_000711 [Haemaphysalis longicornis]|uniref:Uncharacterized protein n=1 Tax=Haemaphysalis longicornis TaxID=44386 RepID=A0A9J6GKW2_HAELO|nr:hypothetical protein HPB48_000711 [Haemaphysalis longicornis]